MYTIALYDGSQHPSVTPISRSNARTEKEARKIAARMLGQKNLRGASTWDHFLGGTVYQFGPNDEDSEFDFVVIDGDDS